jgi:ATP-dependent protease HslVU (ClpYQ) peptidase subunit
MSVKNAQKIAHSNNEVPVNQIHPHAELIAAFKRAQADAAHKFSLIQVVAKKGPRAIQTAIETAAKAEKRRDSYAKKLEILGVVIED